MDAELKRKWVEALRSGEYEQARGYLRERDSYCCLGVLCQVAGLKIVGGNGVIDPETGTDNGYVAISRLLNGKTYFALTERNDGSEKLVRHSFSEIADYIEREL